jgi:hypothetical protein
MEKGNHPYLAAPIEEDRFSNWSQNGCPHKTASFKSYLSSFAQGCGRSGLPSLCSSEGSKAVLLEGS